MSRSPNHPEPPRSQNPGLRRGATALAALLLVSSLALAQPTVNGLFHGDGDVNLYQPYATSVGGSVLYSYLDIATTRLYVALVVNHAVNDLVCSPKSNSVYTASATPPWGSHRDCKRASDSEFAAFTLECAPGSPQSWSWQQALGCAQVAGPPPSSWISAPTCPSSLGVWPPSIAASTSWVQNINTYQANLGNRAWSLYALGTDLNNWKSPFLASSPNNVQAVPGYNTYSTDNGMGLFYQWEWSMVYEWSVNLGPGGTNCGNEAIFFVTGQSHHSPPKSGPENDIFPPPDEPPILSDYGDLPNTYSTLKANNGPRHYLKVNGPYLGAQVQTEGDGVPTAGATGDGPEEDGLTINVTSNWTPGSMQTIQVTVGNAGAGAVLAGWFDWDRSGTFTADEYLTWPVITGVNNLSLTIPIGSDFEWQNHNLAVRLRLFSSSAAAPGGSLGPGDFGDFEGVATDGEVEDYIFAAGSLPVTLNAFSSEFSPGGSLSVRWQTATETDNVGFELLGLVNGDWQPLGEFVASKGMNSALPQSYEVELFLAPDVTMLELVDYDTRGRPERFGPFRPGAYYGELQPARKIDWKRPREKRAERLAERGFVATGQAGSEGRPARWKKLRKAALGPGGGQRTAGSGAEALTHVAVTEPGIQRVSYEALRDAGLDLAGVREGAIAMTWRGEPVSRWIDGRGSFGPGSVIEFVGRPPAGDDALYLDANLYQVAVDPERALAAGTAGRGSARLVPDSYLHEAMVDRVGMFHPQSPTGEPWIERTVLARRNRPRTVDLEIPVAGPVRPGRSRLIVGLGTVTDLPDLAGPGGLPLPEHNVEVWFGGPGSSLAHVADASTSGQQDWRLEVDLPSGAVQPGVNRLQLRFSTDYFFSLVVVDRYGLRYPGPYHGPALDFPRDPRADGYRVEGFTQPAIAVYAEHEDGSLTRLTPAVTAAPGGYAAELRQLEAARFWVSESPHRPAVFTTEPPRDLLAEPAELVVITESSFVGTPALEAYLAARSDLRPVVVDVEDIYNSVGFGMALPSAITDYLRLRDREQPFSHVQLVGTDCYDRLNLISDCVSFIPLPMAPVGVNIYSPNHNRLVDLDGDGVGDKALAQFSVRDEDELATIVRKGEAWRANRGAHGESALWISEETDGIHDFSAQIERLRQRLSWPGGEMLDLTDHPNIATAREALRVGLDAGPALTVFSGHSSPSIWAFRSLLTAGDVADLTNFGLPTIMLPLACETTYDISPDADVLGHQLLYAGEQGALAISGAVALSGLGDNERMAGLVLDGLNAGLTLGEAVQAGREILGSAYQTLQDNWMTQGDVAARIQP